MRSPYGRSALITFVTNSSCATLLLTHDAVRGNRPHLERTVGRDWPLEYLLSSCSIMKLLLLHIPMQYTSLISNINEQAKQWVMVLELIWRIWDFGLSVSSRHAWLPRWFSHTWLVSIVQCGRWADFIKVTASFQAISHHLRRQRLWRLRWTTWYSP